MTLLEEIQVNFANLKNDSVIELKEEKAKYSWVIKLNHAHGVAIKVDTSIEVNEKFSKMNFFTEDYLIEGKPIRLLLITSEATYLRNEFAKICRDFVELGPNYENRNLLTTNPLKWWKHMKELIGNANRNTPVYNIIAEMICFKYLLDNYKEVKWDGPYRSSIDLTTKDGYYEVKSTTNRYESNVSISGQYQLLNDKPQQLLFCRLEKSAHGFSINSLTELLIQNGIEEFYIEERLTALGINKGSTARNESYKILDCSAYTVDENFPKITPESFKNDQLPKHITHVTYNIDLSGLDKQNINIDIS